MGIIVTTGQISNKIKGTSVIVHLFMKLFELLIHVNERMDARDAMLLVGLIKGVNADPLTDQGVHYIIHSKTLSAINTVCECVCVSKRDPM